MDWFNVADGHPDLKAALAHLKLRSACMIGVDSDILFPLRQQREIADALAANNINSRLIALPSDEGHDAFLVDYDRFRPAIAEYFNNLMGTE